MINTHAKFAYPCDLVQEYAGDLAYCYTDDNAPKMCGKSNDQSCKNYMYTKELVEVTVIDEDHSGDVKSKEFEWNSEKSEEFEEGCLHFFLIGS